MRVAYADPPYPGCAHLYPEKTEVDHVEMIARLEEYDGWALSTNENALGYVLGLCPPKVRVLSWCKSNAPPFYSNPIPSWEPVILKPARVGRPSVRSYLVSEAPTGHRRRGDIPGHKPIAFCEWVIRCLGAEREDSLDDLFPGTGVMGETWLRWQAQLTLDAPLVSRGPATRSQREVAPQTASRPVGGIRRVTVLEQPELRPDGLTEAEGVVMDALIRAVEAFARLDRQHPQEINEFIDGIHKCQDLLAVRIARRHYPAGWPVKT